MTGEEQGAMAITAATDSTHRVVIISRGRHQRVITEQQIFARTALDGPANGSAS
jgi:hypothetical protein